jgi:dynein heavy chain 2
MFSEVKLDCIVVNTAGVRSAVDDILQRLFDTLLWTLRHSINTDLQQISQFLNSAITTLSSRPQSVEEIAEANAQHSRFTKTSKQAIDQCLS